MRQTITTWAFPKIGIPPKWMVKIMENPIKRDDLGGKTPNFGNTHISTGEFTGFLVAIKSIAVQLLRDVYLRQQKTLIQVMKKTAVTFSLP